jgi:thiosulfate dehydrogenase
MSFMTVAFGAVAAAGLTLLIIRPPHHRAGAAPDVHPAAAMAASAAPAPRTVVTLPQWTVPDAETLPDNDWGRTVRYGRDLITHTYALIGPEVADPSRRYAGNNLSCQSCHSQAGTKQFGLPFQGVFADFPNYRARSGTVGTIEDRINGCMARSMNGRKLPPDGPDMTAMVAYLKFLSDGRPVGAPTPGRGSGEMAELTRAADPVRGKQVYAQICAACHGQAGQGLRVGSVGDAKGYMFPPLWGPDSFNDGAGMDRLISAANFVHNNMPNGTTWQAPVLSVADAWDVTAYVQSQPRPHKPDLDRDFPKRLQRPVDTGYGPYADGFSQEQHRLGPFGPIRAALARLKAAPATAASQPLTLPASK